MRYQLYREQQLHCDLSTAWEFFSNPGNLSKITPKGMGFVVLTKNLKADIHEGMEIDYTVSPLFRIPIKWKTHIVQVDFQKSFTDFQAKGPYKLWNHHHEFIPNSDGVLMKDTVDYELPLGILGQIAHSLFVKKKLNGIFDYRFQYLNEKFNQNQVK